MAVPVSRVEMQPDVSTYVEDAHVCVGDDVFIQTNNDSLANARGYAAGITAAGLEAIRVDALVTRMSIRGSKDGKHVSRRVMMSRLSHR